MGREEGRLVFVWTCLLVDHLMEFVFSRRFMLVSGKYL